MMLSLNILAVVVIGGLRSIYGTVIGALIVFAVPDLIKVHILVVGNNWNAGAALFCFFGLSSGVEQAISPVKNKMNKRVVFFIII